MIRFWEMTDECLELILELTDLVPLRQDWTRCCRTVEEGLCAAILSASAEDGTLEKVMLALRHLGLLELEVLGRGLSRVHEEVRAVLNISECPLPKVNISKHSLPKVDIGKVSVSFKIQKILCPLAKKVC